MDFVSVEKRGRADGADSSPQAKAPRTQMALRHRQSDKLDSSLEEQSIMR